RVPDVTLRGSTVVFGIILASLLSLASQYTLAQRFPYQPQTSRAGTVPSDPDGAEFAFARLIYGANDGGFRGRGSWTTDWPEAEHFFMEGLTRLTRVDGTPVSIYNGEGGQRISLTDGTLFDFPWLYAVEVGRWSLSSEEIRILREYLLKGGFLMVDDFHGSQEWGGFIAVMQRVFPDRPIIDIPDDDEVF